MKNKISDARKIPTPDKNTTLQFFTPTQEKHTGTKIAHSTQNKIIIKIIAVDITDLLMMPC